MIWQDLTQSNLSVYRDTAVAHHQEGVVQDRWLFQWVAVEDEQIRLESHLDRAGLSIQSVRFSRHDGGGAKRVHRCHSQFDKGVDLPRNPVDTNGFTCPRCGHGRAYRILRHRRWQCVGCRYQVSLTAGTILHNTRTPLTVWFWAAYLMVTDKRGISALLLQRQMGLRRYETAWMLLHKLRRAMVNATREPLNGEVEIDDTWIGGSHSGLRGSRQLKGRKAAIVLVAVEKRGRISGRVRMAVVRNFKKKTMIDFVKQNIAPGSTVYTDGLQGFEGIPKAGVRHIPHLQPPPDRPAQRRALGGATCEPRDRKPEAMADRYLPWGQ